MGIFKIEGGISLQGEITPQGAKMKHYKYCVVLLTPEKLLLIIFQILLTK
jgi:UDP-N-acetylglucosamine 1-carboxyvinyltransferase